MRTPELSHLISQNERTVEAELGIEYLQQSQADTLKAEVVIEANHALADAVYGAEIAALLRARNVERLESLHEDNIRIVAPESEGLDRVTAKAIGVVVLRPEVIDLAAEYREFLARQGLDIVYEKPLQINFAQYWGMYHHGLIHADSYSDFPTRTFNYVDKPLHLLVVTGDGVPAIGVPEALTALKGRQGSHIPGTLRGGIAYAALSNCVASDDITAFNRPEYAAALDPIGMYRQLVRGTVESDMMHEQSDTPLLFYAGQAVHVPDVEELSRDLAVLCSEEELHVIADAVDDRKRSSW